VLAGMPVLDKHCIVSHTKPGSRDNVESGLCILEHFASLLML